MNHILPVLPAGDAWPRLRPLTVDDFMRMGEVGILAHDDRVELIRGALVEMTPIGTPHAETVNRLNRALMRAVGEQAVVSIQNPVELDRTTRPQPDAALLRPRRGGYRRAAPRPDDIFLLVEVADTTVTYDTGRKRLLYAESGIREYWVVRLDTWEVEVSRQPTAEGYQSTKAFGPDAMLTIEALPGVAVAVRDCLPEEDGAEEG